MAYQQNVRTNPRTGNPEILKLAKSKIDRKTGAVLPIFVAYFEIGPQLYKVDISNCNKETKDGNPGMWVKITKVQKQQQTRRGF